MSGHEEVSLNFAKVIRRTDKGILIAFIEGEHEVWLPKSQVIIDEHCFELTIPLWLAEDKEIEVYEA